MKTISKRIISMMLAAMMILSLCGHMAGKAEAKEEQRPGYYKIEFNENGINNITNMPSPKVNWVANAVNYTIPSTVPKRAGYSFEGWYEASNPSTVYKAGQRLTDNLQRNYTLIPKWKLVQGVCNITFNKNGASVTNWPTDFTVSPGVNFQIPNITPKRTGYLFKGWDTSSAAKTIVYTPGQSPVKVSGNLALYPVWVNNQFKTCNDTPGPGNPVMNNYDAGSYSGRLCVGSKGFSLYGWTLANRGVKEYTYAIKTVKGGTTVRTSKDAIVKDSEKIKAFNRTDDKGLVTECSKLQRSKMPDVNMTNSGYRCDSVSLTGLGPGEYYLYVYAKTKDDNLLTVARIYFKIEAKYLVNYYSSKYAGKPQYTEECVLGQVLDKAHCEAALNASPVEYGKYRVWYSMADNKEVKLPITIKDTTGLYYEDKNYSCTITFKNSDGKDITTKKMYTGDKFEQIGTPTDPTGKKVFVGWSEDKEAVIHKTPIYQREHYCVFGKDEPAKVLYAIYVAPNQTFSLKYRLNYKDLSNTRAYYNSHIYEVAVMEKNGNNTTECIVKSVKDATGKLIAIFVKSDPLKAGIKMLAGKLIDAVAGTSDSKLKSQIVDEAKKDLDMLVREWNTMYYGACDEHLRNKPENDRIMNASVYFKDGVLTVDLLNETMEVAQ